MKFVVLISIMLNAVRALVRGWSHCQRPQGYHNLAIFDL